MSTDALWNAFENPGIPYRGKPFWSWNGLLRKDELLRQIRVIKAMGFGGFFMHSRVGLATEYLGDEWFDLINTCSEEAENLGMEAWLYDEDRWPSGIAGGLVTCEPQYRGRYVLLTIREADEWSELKWNEDLLAVFLAHVDGLAYYDCQRVESEHVIKPGEDRSLLVFRVVEAPTMSFYNGYTYVDLMNEHAVKRFIEVTHEEYRKRCGAHFGKTIRGIFTDEPHRGALMDGFCINEPDAQWRAPWTPALPERFLHDFGYDIIERLPEVFLRPEGRAISQVKWHYVEILSRLFIDSFAKPLNAWCEANNLILTGHYLHEDSLTAQVAMAGSMMRFYEHMGYPGVDVLTERNDNYWIVKQLSSAARQLGKTWLLSELYGCTGWQMSFAGHKAVGEWQTLLGITVRCHHLSWYTMEGEAKRDYPASILHQSAWWTAYETVETYFSRLHVLMSQGQPVCDLLVIHPVESVWCQIYPGWSRWLSAQEPAVKDLEKAHADLFHWLAGAQLDFDYGDEEMVGRLGCIDSPGGTPVLRVGKACYRAVVVGGMTTMRASTLALLKAFQAAGGAVIFAGTPPAYVDALESGEAETLASSCTCTAFEKASLLKACDSVLGGPRVRVFDEKGQVVPSVFAQARQADDCQIVMLLNVDRDVPVERAIVRVRGVGIVEEWNCLRGSRQIVPTRTVDNGLLEFEESFAPAGSHIYRIVASEADVQAVEVRPMMREVERHVSKGAFRYRLTEPNVCVLDFASYRVEDGTWQEPVEILKADQAVRKQLGIPLRGGEMLQPWFAAKHGCGNNVTGRVEFRYTFDIGTMPNAPVELAMESPHAYALSLNGVSIDPIAACGWWVDKAISRLPLPSSALRLGENVIEMATDFHYGTNPEALYLLGAFGVRLRASQRILCALPAKLRVGDAARQRLPFYSGGIVYEVPVIRRPGDGERFVLSTGAFGGACVRIHGETQAVVIPWAPYEADVTELVEEGADSLLVEVILSRRNTFGPLHEYPGTPGAVGPGNFTTEGKAFRESYVLVPSGLLTPPEIRVMRS